MLMSAFVLSRDAAEEEKGAGHISGLRAWWGEPGRLEAQRRQSHPGAPMGAGENWAAAWGGSLKTSVTCNLKKIVSSSNSKTRALPCPCHSSRWRRPVTCSCWGRSWEMRLQWDQLPPPNPWASRCPPAWARAPCPPPPPSPHRSPVPPLKAPSRPARAAATTRPTSRAWWIVRRSWLLRWEQRSRRWWFTHQLVTPVLWTDQSHLCSLLVPAPPDTHLQQWI